MATTRFRMDPDQMEALSRELDGLYQSDFRAITRALTQIDHALGGAWTGPSRQAFQAQFAGWVRATEPLGHSLLAIALFLREAAAEYRRLDATLAQRDLADAHQQPHTGRQTAPPTPAAWAAFLASLPAWQVALLQNLVDLWQRGLPSPFVRGVGGGGAGASAGTIALEQPDWLQWILSWFIGGASDDPIPAPQVNDLGDDGCVMTDDESRVLYNLLCSPPEPQAEQTLMQWLASSAPVAGPGGPLVDAPVLVPGQDPNDEDEPGSSGNGGASPRGGGGGGDDILDDITRPIAGNGNRVPETVDEARVRVGEERFNALAWDPEAGRMRENEALVAVDLENRGVVPGPVERANMRGVDFVDSAGHQWDVKGWHSDQPNGYSFSEAIQDIQREVGYGEYIIVDTSNMRPEHVAELSQAVTTSGLNQFVLWWP
jgi:WXG100 family type VII secretion target